MKSLLGRDPSRILVRSVLTASLGALLWAPAAHAAELASHWSDPGNSRYELTQTGAAVVTSFPGSTEIAQDRSTAATSR
jgi:hypothetical protein